MNEDSILNNIRCPEDVKRVPASKLPELAQQIREFIVEHVAKSGGHLASSLGAVEITLALHRVLDLPKDKVIFDVGHQVYAHKILTGRREAFDGLRACGGISGFPKCTESEYDCFDTGHASTSISAALGMARARQLNGTDETIVALIGDGALTGGMAYEALNDAGQSKLALIVLLNDNDMSISRNVGALNRHLNRLRSSNRYQSFKRYIVRQLDKTPKGQSIWLRLERFKSRIKYFLLPNVLFEALGFTYLGPIDGHNTQALEQVIAHAKSMNRPVIIHAVTQKGKGYPKAESNPEEYHGIGPFNLEDGEPVKSSERSNSMVFGDTLVFLAQTDRRVVAITAAMKHSTGLAGFERAYPKRFFDVGIAEAHAVTMAAGMASFGYKPVVAIYSSFLQRAYDQILHDVCLQNLPVVFAVDRAGLVGEDGETHQGLFDISYLLGMPNMTIYSPSTQADLERMLAAALECGGPVAIRYSRSALPVGNRSEEPIDLWRVKRPVRDVNVIATGRMLSQAQAVADACGGGLVEAPRIKPMDFALLDQLKNSKLCAVIEDGVSINGFGAAVASYLSRYGVRVECFGAPDRPISQGSIAEQDEACGMTSQEILGRIRQLLERA